MAFRVRKGSDAVQYALVASYNSLRQAVATAQSLFHRDVTNASDGAVADYLNPTATAMAVTSANASDLATSLTLVNELKLKYNRHAGDAVAHRAADTTNVVAVADATNLATAQTLANDIKAKYTAHLSQSGVHVTNDSTNTVAAANASDQTTLNTLLNELKGDFNAHIASAPAGHSVVLISA